MDFFESILPPSGLYCIASAKLEKQKDGKGKLSKLVHISFDSLASLKESLPGIVQSNSNRELYFSPSTYAESRDPNNGFRRGDNVHAVKSLYLDVDIRTEAGFCNNYEEALVQVELFRKSAGLPNPWIVDSGAGLHVYWPLSKAVDAAAWMGVALGFFEAVQGIAPKLIADATRSRDKAALLRLPGSTNHKHAKSKIVSILQEADGEVDWQRFYKKDLPLVQGSDNEYALVKPEDRVSMEHVVKACNWVREYVRTQETASEPEWYAALSLSRFTYVNDPNSDHEAAIALSKGHPGYTLAGTLKKLDQLSTGGIGPSTCATLGGMFPERCRTCPLRGFVNSPIAAGRKISNTSEQDRNLLFTVGDDGPQINKLPVEDSAIPEPPKPFFIKDGQVFMHKADSIVRIFEYVVMPVNRAKDEYTGQEMVEFLIRFPHDGDRTIKVPMSLLADDKRLGIFLADYGILPERSVAPHFFRYLVAYVRELQAHRPAVRQYAQLGWRFPDINDQNKAEFILGDVVYTNGRWVPNSSVSPALLPSKASATGAGSLEKWREGFNSLKSMTFAEPLIAAALMGFAAPLIEFTPYNGVLVNLYGGSGRGKSTAQRFATSIWGVPNERMILTHDNRIPMLNRMGAMRNLPVTFDELTEMEPEALGTLLYEMSGGRGKERANISGVTRANEATWKTVVISSSNVSIYSKIARIRAGNNGQAYRVLELEVGPVLAQNALLIDHAKNLLDSNYGLSGRVFAEHLVNNVVTVRRLVLESMAHVTTAYQESPAERFWLTAVAAMRVGGKIAKDLGLHSYDVDAAVKWVVDAMKNTREAVRDMLGDPINIINQFLIESLNSTVKDDGGMVMVPPNAKSVSVRYRAESGIVVEAFVSKKAVIDYCKYYKVEYGWLLAALRDTNMLKSIRKVDLLERTGMPSIEVDCFVLNTDVLSNMDCVAKLKNLSPLPADSSIRIN